MRAGGARLWALCLIAGVFPCREARADSVDNWAVGILRKARSAVPFVALERQGEVAAASANAAMSLPPWSLAVSGSHTEYASARSLVGTSALDSLSKLEVTTNKYVGYGLDLGTTVGVSHDRYTKAAGLPVSFLQGIQIDLSLSMDLWRDRFGRFTQAQRETMALAAQASIHDAAASAETRALNVLSTAIDACVLAEQHREALVTADIVAKLLSETEMREKAKLISPGELIQFESLMLSLQQSLEQMSQRQATIAKELEANYGLTFRLTDCPVLKLPPAEPGAAGKGTPKAKDAGSTVADTSYPEIRAAQYRIEAGKRALGVAEMSKAPTLKPFVAATGARLGRGFDSAASGMFKNYRNWGGTAGVTLEWDFGTPQLEYERQAAALGLSAARLGLDETRSSVSSRIDELKIQMRSIRGLVELLARQRALTTEYLEIEKSRFAIGRSSAFVLTSAYQSYQGVVSSMPDLVAQWYKAHWQVESLRGKLLAPLKEDARGSADSAR